MGSPNSIIDLTNDEAMEPMRGGPPLVLADPRAEVTNPIVSNATAYTAWMVTVNNPTVSDKGRCIQLVGDNTTWDEETPIRYLVGQLERGKNGTHHLQLYIQLWKRKRLTWLKNNLWAGAHYERRRGTHQQAVDYVTKADTRVNVHDTYLYGTPVVTQGQRNDILAFRDAVAAGRTLQELVLDDDLCKVVAARPRFQQTVLMALQMDARTEPTILHIRWGPSHTGKSHWARQQPGAQYWLSPPRCEDGAVWWCGYAGQHTVVVDEFDGYLSQKTIKRLVDKYPFQVQTKGGSVPFVSKEVIILSNISPRCWWGAPTEMAVLRRVTTCKKLTEVYQPAELATMEERIKDFDLD